MIIEKIALVNNDNQIIGYEDKMKVHELGLLHRAYSIFIFNDNNELLLQKRASIKYHSPSLWSNTCCSHLLSNENMEEAIHRRLIEEMGFDCNLTFLKTITYKIQLDNKLIENEIDHIFVGYANLTPILNPNEVSDYKWINIQELIISIKKNPLEFTYWLKEIVYSINLEAELLKLERAY